jgi:tetratricopeptide (TPR) repeat protein
MSQLDVAAEQLLSCAREAGDRANAFVALFFLTAWGVIGPNPVDDALRLTQAKFRPLAQGPLEEAAVAHLEGLLRGMRGELEEGRSIIQGARATFAEFGAKLTAIGTARDEALIARYAGDAATVERVLRPACDELRAGGNTGFLSTLIGELADALYELERYDEAVAATVEGERLAQDADLYPQAVWRRVRAKALAQRGHGDEARQLAQEAIEWAGRMDGLEPLADAYWDLAEIEHVVGHDETAGQALEHALALYERKGLVPMAERARQGLAGLRDRS